MPNRFIKESIKRSPQIDKLTWFEEVVFYRLIVTADDYGRYYGNPIVLRNDLFPTKESITKKSIEDALRRLAAQGLIIVYEADGEQYVALTTWKDHQSTRAAHSKFPDPSASNCKQMFSNVFNPQANENKCSAYSYSNSYSYSYSERENAPAHARGELKPYGKFENVMLSETEHAALQELIPGATDYIERFSAKIAAKGYKYDNHYAAIVSWYIDDKKDDPESSFDVDDFFQAALERGRRWAEEIHEGGQS